MREKKKRHSVSLIRFFFFFARSSSRCAHTPASGTELHASTRPPLGARGGHPRLPPRGTTRVPNPMLCPAPFLPLPCRSLALPRALWALVTPLWACRVNGQAGSGAPAGAGSSGATPRHTRAQKKTKSLPLAFRSYLPFPSPHRAPLQHSPFPTHSPTSWRLPRPSASRRNWPRSRSTRPATVPQGRRGTTFLSGCPRFWGRRVSCCGGGGGFWRGETCALTQNTHVPSFPPPTRLALPGRRLLPGHPLPARLPVQAAQGERGVGERKN